MSPTRRRVLALLETGMPKAEIARTLGISRQAVYLHVWNHEGRDERQANRKLDAAKRAVRRMREHLEELERAINE